MEIFDFFLTKALDQMNEESLSNISSKLDPEKARKYSNIIIRTVTSNSTQEFHEIIDEYQLMEKLARLDELKKNDGVSVDMKNFTFTPARQEDIKSRVEYDAKKGFIRKLKTILSSLDERINEIHPRAEEAHTRVNQAEYRINELKDKINSASSH